MNRSILSVSAAALLTAYGGRQSPIGNSDEVSANIIVTDCGPGKRA